MERSKIRRVFVRFLEVTRKIAIALGLLIILVVVWGWYLNRPPHYTITPPAVPADNALDYFQRASEARQYIDELGSIRIDWNNGELKRKDQSPPLAVMLAENRQSLHFIREGIQHECVIPLNLHDDSNWYDAHSKLRRCRQLLEVNALYQFNTSEAGSAANALLDVIQFNTRTSCYAGYYQKHGCSQLQALSDRLSVDEARTATARLESITSQRPSFADSLRLAKPVILSQMISYLNGSDIFNVEGANRWKTNRWFFAIPLMTPSPLEDRSLLVNQLYNWTVPNSMVPGIADRYLTECIRVAEQPFSRHAAYPSPPRDTMNWWFFAWAEHDRNHLSWLMWAFQHDSLMLSIALHGYRREHGRYPAKLEDLVKDQWLKTLPVDPFTGQDTICYHNDGKTFTLYSRGPDGKDDGGKPITNPVKKRPRMSEGEIEYIEHVVRRNSRGDIVYGIHTNAEMGRMRI